MSIFTIAAIGPVIVQQIKA